MTKHPAIGHRGADLRREAVPARAADGRRGNCRHGPNDLMLVLGVAAVVLGVVMVSQGVLLSQPAAQLVPRAHAALMPAERGGSAPDERLAAGTSRTDRVSPTHALRTGSRGASTGPATCFPRSVTTCPPHFELDLDHDLRLTLAAMALQGRRYPREWPVAPDKAGCPGKRPCARRCRGIIVRPCKRIAAGHLACKGSWLLNRGCRSSGRHHASLQLPCAPAHRFQSGLMLCRSAQIDAERPWQHGWISPPSWLRSPRLPPSADRECLALSCGWLTSIRVMAPAAPSNRTSRAVTSSMRSYSWVSSVVIGTRRQEHRPFPFGLGPNRVTRARE